MIKSHKKLKSNHYDSSYLSLPERISTKLQKKIPFCHNNIQLHLHFSHLSKQ